MDRRAAQVSDQTRTCSDCFDFGKEGQRGRAGGTARKQAHPMIILGVILIILGVVLTIPVLYTIGIVLAIVGIILWVLGSMGRAVGGRNHYY